MVDKYALPNWATDGQDGLEETYRATCTCGEDHPQSRYKKTGEVCELQTVALMIDEEYPETVDNLVQLMESMEPESPWLQVGYESTRTAALYGLAARFLIQRSARKFQDNSPKGFSLN